MVIFRLFLKSIQLLGFEIKQTVHSRLLQVKDVNALAVN